ncbi:MAG TPA: methyltransferase domain-containing protein, partial [Candidatus Eisenbacteria bacterium]|nr:methyltransferase domain-containing protein [Candidatus Eisenbacteria bacterium]
MAVDADAQPHDDVVLRRRMLAELEAAGRITSPHVERAFQSVPRHVFVSDVDLAVAYHDDVIFTKSRDGVSLSACSSPSIVAEMLELLDVRPGHRVLEIGAGTGYNAALLEELVGAAGRVVTLDIDQDIVDAATTNLRTAGRGAGVDVRCGDGGFGWVAGSPYDRVIVTAGAWDVAPAWFDQLAVGGRLVVPMEFRDVH